MSWRGVLKLPMLESVAARRRLPRFALEMLVALSLAFLVWLYLRTRHQESLDHVPVPVHIVLAAEFADKYDLEVEGSRHVVASFIGPPSRIHELRAMLERGEVHVTVPVPVASSHRDESRYRETIRIHAADVPAPPGVTVLIAGGGNRIPVVVHKLGERQLPVRLEHSLEDRIGQVDISPETVLVKGPQDVLEHAVSIPTVRYHLPLLSKSGGKLPQEQTVEVALVHEMEGRPIHPEQATVRVRIALKPRPRVHVLANVPVSFLCPASFPYRPQVTAPQVGRIGLRVKAPGTTPPVVMAYVDLTQGKFRPGLNVQPVRLQLPKDCVLAQDAPGPLEFDLIPMAPASGWVVTEP